MEQRILVIDDEAVIGISCKRILAPEGHEVEVYQDPQAGLRAALSGAFDVILVDLMMPGLGGLEILERVKSAGIASEVVIITGHSTVETAVEAMKQGAADYLSKPFSPDQLKMLLAKVFERSSLIRENAAYGEIRDNEIIFRPDMGREKMIYTPEKCVQAQFQYGSDIMMALDLCTSPDDPYDVQRRSVELTVKWGARCRAEFDKLA